YLAQELTRYKLGEVAPMAHFGLTSEDVNNLAYGLVIREATEYLVRVGADFLEGLIELVRGLGKSVMLARTHGQPAVPTTMAKELLVHARRMADAMMLISDLRIEGKLLGAVGTMAAHRFVFAEKDWLRFSKEFVKGLGLEPILLSTQVVAPTSYMRMMSALVELGMHIEAFCIDMWHYISLGYFKQSFDAKSVGSSTMPQKVNPIRFENAEGNAGLAIALAMA
ncbi:MAG: adenylosuccinate lyase, partial [Phototrophicales bacterium]